MLAERPRVGQRHVDDGGVQNFHKHRQVTTIATAHGLLAGFQLRGCDPSFHGDLRFNRQPQRQRGFGSSLYQ